MAFCGLFNSYSRNHLHLGLCRHFGKRSVSIWRSFLCPPWSPLFDSTHSFSLSASGTFISKHFSIWNKHSLSCPFLRPEERRFNISKLGLHYSSSFLQEEAITQPNIKDDKLTETLQGNTTDKSSVNEHVSTHCQNSEAQVTVNTTTESTLSNESLTNCTEFIDECPISMDKEASFTENISAEEETSSQMSVPLTTGWLMCKLKTLKILLQNCQGKRKREG